MTTIRSLNLVKFAFIIKLKKIKAQNTYLFWIYLILFINILYIIEYISELVRLKFDNIHVIKF